MKKENLASYTLSQHGEEIIRASKNLKGIIQKTDVIYSEFFSREYGNNVYIKPENLQLTGSFKIRGAYNKIFGLSEEEKKRGIIAASAGNHAQGVAFSAQKLNISSVIVMPKITPLIKIASTRSYGSEVFLHGNVYDESYKKAVEMSLENGYTFIHPFDDYGVIYGQGTVGLEILRELKDTNAILVPVGGGGLISGIALIAKSINPKIKVIGVEPVGAMAMKLSLEKGSVFEIDSCSTNAEGVAVKRPGNITYDITSKYVDNIISVTEEDITEALLLLVEKHKLICETSAVLTVAALKKLNIKNKNVVSVLSGGNIDVLTISSLINKGLVSRGRIFCFSVDLPDIPGQLMKISRIIAELNGNVIKLDHNQFKASDRFTKVQLEITVETTGNEHIQKIIASLAKEGFSVRKVY
ncbi:MULTISPECIES: threonine ammonia-lyase [unclassified Sedimentibacter]|uniref:threonine ammonia-lyase n=1 Tax=unclassified Sedimentibacter TaxID=2649220 RepID=UPI0027E11EE7|nr:threonine ammonia-lyase [Sedimentibacter sp. MB35-C1]WMJ77943.1 threonine ammonia-lyase [Sedimentibacter sp. MB35-C1]